jgi:hypothetical protein
MVFSKILPLSIAVYNGFDHEIPICGRVTAGRRDFIGFERLRG